jgi:hypothetical protein
MCLPCLRSPEMEPERNCHGSLNGCGGGEDFLETMSQDQVVGTIFHACLNYPIAAGRHQATWNLGVLQILKEILVLVPGYWTAWKQTACTCVVDSMQTQAPTSQGGDSASGMCLDLDVL